MVAILFTALLYTVNIRIEQIVIEFVISQMIYIQSYSNQMVEVVKVLLVLQSYHLNLE